MTPSKATRWPEGRLGHHLFLKETGNSGPVRDLSRPAYHLLLVEAGN